MNIVKGIIKSVSQLWQSHELEDFTVIVDGDIYSCHSVILAGCSEFFRGLMKSNMKEKQEMKVHLMNVSSPTFKIILNSLYTGCEFLTKENILEVWSAVHQLQIQFLIEHCEDFVKTDLSFDTLEMYKEHAEYLQSVKVGKFIFNYMLKNFSTLRKQEIFLRFDLQSIKRLLRKDKLEVSSEDEVMEAIFDWINYGSNVTNKADIIQAATGNESQNASLKVNDNQITEEQAIVLPLNQEETNERKKFLFQLITSSRYYLASEECIVKLYTNKLVQSDTPVKEIFFEAFTFKLCDYLHGHWPTPAIHRDCSNLEHVGVFCLKKSLRALSFKQNKWFSLQTLPSNLYAHLTIFNGQIYACSQWRSPNKLYVLESKEWLLLREVYGSIQLVLTHKRYIYLFHSNETQITRFNPENCSFKQKPFRHQILNLQHALSFHNNIVIFSSVDNNIEEETSVYSWNTDTNVWTKLDNLNFSSQNMTSFRGDKDTYILDSNGNMWKLTNSDTVGFTFIAKLWSEKCEIKGAVLFRATLFMFVESSPDDIDILDEVKGVFSKYVICKIKSTASNISNYCIATKELLPL